MLTTNSRLINCTIVLGVLEDVSFEYHKFGLMKFKAGNETLATKYLILLTNVRIIELEKCCIRKFHGQVHWSDIRPSSNRKSYRPCIKTFREKSSPILRSQITMNSCPSLMLCTLHFKSALIKFLHMTGSFLKTGLSWRYYQPSHISTHLQGLWNKNTLLCWGSPPRWLIIDCNPV